MTRTLPPAAYRLIGIVGTSRIVTRLHPVAYRWFGGAGPVGRSFGMRSVVVTTTGRRTGERRDVPLYAIEDGDRLVVVGSNAGRDTEPSWVGNLRAEPRATVRVGRTTRPVRAYEATGDERERLWAAAVEAFPGYAGYATRTSRPIPVIVLEPAREAPA